MLWAAYGAGHFGKSLLWHGSELLFAFYLTEVCGLAPPVMAGILAGTLFASGAMDIVVGHRLRTRIRSVFAAARMQALGSVGAGAAFLLFLATERVFGSQSVFAALGAGMAFRLAYSFYDVPQNAVLALAGDERLRTGLSSLRFVCSGLASLAIAALAPLLLANGSRSAWFATFGAGVCLAGIGSSLLFLQACGRAGSPARACPALPVQFAGNAGPRAWRPALLLLCLGFGIGAAGAVFMKLEPYFAIHVLHNATARTALMVAVACGGIAGQPCMTRLARRRGLPAAFRLAALVLAAGALVFVAAATSGTPYASAAGFVVGFGLNGLGMLLWTAVGNLATGGNAPAPTVLFGLLTFSQKTASALGTVVTGAALAWNDAAPATLAVVAPLVMAMGAVPLLGALACLLLAAGLAPRPA